MINSGNLFGEDTRGGRDSSKANKKKKKEHDVGGEQNDDVQMEEEGGDPGGRDGNKAAKEKEEAKSKRKKKEKPQVKCFYCKLEGHTGITCLERKAVLCIRCFEFGHNKNHCKNAMKIISMDDIA